MSLDFTWKWHNEADLISMNQIEVNFTNYEDLINALDNDNIEDLSLSKYHVPSLVLDGPLNYVSTRADKSGSPAYVPLYSSIVDETVNGTDPLNPIGLLTASTFSTLMLVDATYVPAGSDVITAVYNASGWNLVTQGGENVEMTFDPVDLSDVASPLRAFLVCMTASFENSTVYVYQVALAVQYRHSDNTTWETIGETVRDAQWETTKVNRAIQGGTTALVFPVQTISGIFAIDSSYISGDNIVTGFRLVASRRVLSSTGTQRSYIASAELTAIPLYSTIN